MSSVRDDYANAEYAEEQHQKLLEEERAEQRQQASHADTKQWLQEQLDQQTRTIPVMGREFEFSPVGTETVTETLELIPDGMDDMNITELPELLRQVCDLLAEHCMDPAMDREAWGRIQPEVVEEVFADLVGGELDQEQLERVESFRNE